MLDVRALQRPLKSLYREAPERAVIRTTARCTQADPEEPRVSLLEAGSLHVEVGAHEGVGGTGREPCSGDLLLSALAACQQITLQLVAAAMGIRLESSEVEVTGDLDLRGTLGLEREVPVGYRELACEVRVSAPGVAPEQLEKLAELARRYCVVHATLQEPPRIAWRFSPEPGPARTCPA